MTPARLFPIFILVLLLCLSRARAGNVGCPEILRKINSHVSTGHGEKPIDLSDTARDLGTSIPWVEHCMQIYGRRSRRPGLESAEERETMLEDIESEEPEETAPEDVDEGGSRERPIHPVKPRYAVPRAEPTPRIGSSEKLD